MIVAAWCFVKTVYNVFYCMSYKVESQLNRMNKVANQIFLFVHTILLTYALFNHNDKKQYEFGNLSIFVVITLMFLNIIVTLNPIIREDRVDLRQRSSCCSGTNIMQTISIVFCF